MIRFKETLRIAAMVLALVLLSPLCRSGHAQTPLRQVPDKVIGFANDLMAQGDAFRAVTEYRAFVFLFPEHPRVAEAYYFLGRAYQAQNQWDEALNAFRHVAYGERQRTPWAQEAALEIGETILLAGHPAAAARSYEEAARTPGWEDIHGQALYRAAWSWMQAGQYEKAVRILKGMPSEDPLHTASQRLSEEILEGVSNLPRRSPWVAGGLSAVFPGSGHLYVGRTKEGLTSFLLNGAFIVGAIWAFREGYPITGGILSFFELSWYFGGITSAARGARQFNRAEEENWLQNLGPRWGLSLDVDPERRETQLKFSWRF